MTDEIRILVVDDFEMARLSLTSGLADLGYTNVNEADGGAPAISMLEKMDASGTPYSIVICDWVMPEVAGIEVLKFCRNHPHYKEVPFVMLTAEAEQSSIVQAFRAGVTEYWTKPISPDVLERKLNTIVASIRAKSA